MNDHIDPAIVEVAAKASYDNYRIRWPGDPVWHDTNPEIVDAWLADTTAALEAAAPLIAAKALRDFADAHRLPFIVFQDEDNYPHTVNDLLRAEAEGYAKKVQS